VPADWHAWKASHNGESISEGDGAMHRSSRRLPLPVVSAVFLCVVFLLLLSMTMHKDLNHDEHQFVAAGQLLATRSLLPYRDYPYFHMPNLVFVYAAIFRFTDHLLLGARLFSFACASLSMMLIFCTALAVLRGHHWTLRFLVGAGVVLVLLSNPLFTYTSGRTWNHDLPVLLTLAAFIVHCQGARRQELDRWIFFSGALVGAAVGTRLSYGLALAPFAGVIFVGPGPATVRRRLRLLLSFSAGVLVALLPSLLIFVLAPQQFVFGNIGYDALNTMYRQAEGYQVAMTAGGKLIYFMQLLSSPGNWALFLPLACFALSNTLGRKQQRVPNSFEIIFILLLVPCLLVGSFAPTPSWPQYFYAPVPFLALAIVYALQALHDQHGKLKWGLAALAPFVVISSLSGISHYRNVGNLLSPEEWRPTRVHQLGVAAADIIGEGPVLTLEPIYPLEGGAQIYEAFATGAFAWRTAPFLPEASRSQLGMISERELPGLLATRPPGGILVGREADLESSIVEYASEKGCSASPLSARITLWVCPGS
jgi:4-amino-4-deoxy-L-arabinose transferase-like glycosyltransferase